jgi:N-acyl-phosphatidylethanolamine-hydrolysing phospholipase D
MDDFMFLTDPVFSDRCGITANIGPKRYRPPALTVDDLPDKLEAIVISHNHYDHLDYPSVMSLHKRYGNALTWFCGLGVSQWFRDCHIENVVELDWWEEWKHPV